VAAEIRLPLEHPNDTEAEIIQWLVDDGQWVDAGTDLLEVESTKAVNVVDTESSGYVRRHVAVGDAVTTGAVLARVHPTVEELAADMPHAQPPDGAGADGAGVRFSAEGLRELTAHGLSPAVFRGRGLVTAQLVREFAAAEADGAAGPVRRHPIGPAKLTEISRLSAGAGALASALTVRFDSARTRAALHRQEPVQPLVLAVLIQGVAQLLREFPELNACFADRHVAHYTRVNVGVAVDLGQGLRVPVLKDADRMDPVEITIALLDAMAAYHERRLSSDDLAGGTVTVSDLSGEDVFEFHPLINQDQALALGVGGDSRLPGHPMTITAVFDHRVSSGRTVAAFLGRLKAHLLGVSE
jgi:2-oxoglutarate dehydrogenase E2 component (dihydrolipoamide succinyltransferase)